MTADLLSLYHTALPSASYVPAIIALTLTVRLTALPLVYLGLREQSKLTRVIPDIQFIHSLYKKKLSELPINATADRITATQKFVKGTRAVMAYKGFSPLLMFVSPLAQVRGRRGERAASRIQTREKHKPCRGMCRVCAELITTNALP